MTDTAKYYRARITLEEVTPKPTTDSSSYRDTIIDEIAEISVKGDSPGAAMNQIVAHAQELAATHADIIITPGSWAAGVFVPVDPVAVGTREPAPGLAPGDDKWISPTDPDYKP